jgi:uncharacterized membrane protein YcaP (DUF421 family)
MRPARKGRSSVIVFIRAILLYLLIIFCLRLMGKRQLGELQPSELVITILISNIASLPIEDNSIPMIMGVVPIVVLVGFELIISSISLRSKRFRTLVSGKPMIIVRNGQIDQSAMKKLRFSIDDLMETLRGKSIFDIRDVQYAIVETTGQVNILQKHAAQTVTAQMLDLKGKDADPPAVIISDGKVIRTALDAYGLTDAWLASTLRENRYTEQDIFLMTADRSCKYFIVPMDRVPTKGGAA